MYVLLVVNNCVTIAFNEYLVTCIRCAASALRPVSTPRLSSHLSCAIWVNACVRPPSHPQPPQRTMGTDCIYQIQECSSNGEEARSRRQPHPTPTPTGASRTIRLSVRFSSSFFLGGRGVFSGSRCLPGYFVHEQACWTDIWHPPVGGGRWGLCSVVVPVCAGAPFSRLGCDPTDDRRAALTIFFFIFTRSSSLRPLTVLGYCDSGLFSIFPCSVSLHRRVL